MITVNRQTAIGREPIDEQDASSFFGRKVHEWNMSLGHSLWKLDEAIPWKRFIRRAKYDRRTGGTPRGGVLQNCQPDGLRGLRVRIVPIVQQQGIPFGCT